MNVFINDRVFEKRDFKTNALKIAEYDGCKFVDCNFEEVHLSTFSFTDCIFEDCNLTNVQLNQASFNNVTFINSKLVGVHFYKSGGFTFLVNFIHCQLNLASFYNMNLSGTIFKDCNLQEVDFTDANLTGVNLHHCNLISAIFNDTNLEKADLRTAYNFTIDPELNRLKKAKFSLQNVNGLLEKYEVKIE